MGSRITREDTPADSSNEPVYHIDDQARQMVIQKMAPDLEALNLATSRARLDLGALMEHSDEATKRKEGITPQKHIPPEILGKIFVHCLDGEAVPVPPLPSPSMPWLLGHICSRWRKIALDEHQLWENVMFISCKFFPRLAFEEVIRRSGESRIVNLSPLPSEYFRIILPILQRNHNRFQSLKIEITRPTAKLLAEMSLFERLQTLSIHYGHPLLVSNKDDPLHPEFSAPPSLRRLTLTSDTPNQLPLHGMRINPTAPFWARLTHFEIGISACVPIFTMLLILEQCEALIDCSICVCDESGSVRSDSEPITVPSLQSIMAQSVDPILTDFFASLNLPSLKTLQLVGLSEPWPQREILALLDRSGCHLEGFYNADFMMSVECVTPLVRAMPFVTHVSLDTDAPIPHSTIDAIISEDLLSHLVFVTAWFDSSRAALKLVENTWACSQEPGGGVRRGILYIDSADVTADEEACRTLKRAVSQSGGDIEIAVC